MDPQRGLIAGMCFELVLRFIAMHELVHIVHGHVGYICRGHTPAFILEIMRDDALSLLSRNQLDRQAIELWADGKAVQTVLGGFLGDASATPKDPRARLFLWSFAIYTLFRIWGLKIDPTILKDCDTHPPTTMRFELSVVGAGMEVAETIPAVTDEYISIVHDGQLVAEKGIRYCGGNALIESDIIGSRSPAVLAHREALLKHHDDVLRNEMHKYTWIDLK